MIDECRLRRLSPAGYYLGYVNHGLFSVECLEIVCRQMQVHCVGTVCCWQIPLEIVQYLVSTSHLLYDIRTYSCYVPTLQRTYIYTEKETCRCVMSCLRLGLTAISQESVAVQNLSPNNSFFHLLWVSRNMTQNQSKSMFPYFSLFVVCPSVFCSARHSRRPLSVAHSYHPRYG